MFYLPFQVDGTGDALLTFQVSDTGVVLLTVPSR